VPEALELTVNLGGDRDSLTAGEEVSLFAQTSYPVVNYSWTNSDFINTCDTCQLAVVTPPESMAFGVTVTDENGCTASDRITLFVRKTRDVYIPNAFSPDDDGTNDEFMIFGNNDIEEVRSFLVFNRWGETVFEAYNFEAENPAAGWDGTHRGEMMNAGVYIYVAEVLFRDGEVRLYKGDVMLMR